MKRLKFLRLPLFFVLAIWSVSAQAAPQASSWQVDYAKSKLGFTGSQGGAEFQGWFSHYDAKIDFDPANPTKGHAVVVIDITSAATGEPQKDEALPLPEWFDAKSFPQARFEATTFRAVGGNAYEAVGTLTIRNITKEVVLPFTVDIADKTAQAQGRLPLIRTDYSVGQGPWASGRFVALEVAVVLDLTASR